MKTLRWFLVALSGVIVLLNLMPVAIVAASKAGLIAVPRGGSGAVGAIYWSQLVLWTAAILFYAVAAVRLVRGRPGALTAWSAGLALDAATYVSYFLAGNYAAVRGAASLPADLLVYAVIVAVGAGMLMIRRKGVFAPPAGPATAGL